MGHHVGKRVRRDAVAVVPIAGRPRTANDQGGNGGRTGHECHHPEVTSEGATAGRSRLGVGLGLVLMLLSACGLGQQVEPTDSQWEDMGPVLTVSDTHDGMWPAALVAGKLTLRGGCFLIGRNVAVFPHDTLWERPYLHFPTGDRIELGTRVRLGGAMGGEMAGLTLGENTDVPVAAMRKCAAKAGVRYFVLASP